MEISQFISKISKTIIEKTLKLSSTISADDSEISCVKNVKN